MAKKLTKYQKHVQREMKQGRTLKQAASSWQAKKKSPSKKTTSKKRASKKTSKSRKKPTRRIRRRSRPSGQKALFPRIRQMVFQGGPIRQKIQRVLGV